MYNASKTKPLIRKHTFNYLKECSTVLTMPNLYFDLEQSLLNSGCSVECVEYKKEIYEQQLISAPSDIKLYNADLKNINVKKYDGMFLDMCGTFSKAVEVSLNNAVPQTKIVLTLLMLRESRKIQQYVDINNRYDTYLSFLDTFNFAIEKTIEYKDNLKSPMCVFFGKKL